ncbi:MAG TPA: hypothetical protein VKA15_22440 [Isosphaeraceae bacterium]|nr:hypothetical protein [Isosphaeraceae bacterium]
MPLPLSKPDARHAVCLVGHELRPNAPGGGVFIFRNSWGKTWAAKSRYKAGYGTLFFEYVRQYAVEAYFIASDGRTVRERVDHQGQHSVPRQGVVWIGRLD